jgi:glycosyltransferase involved in cell wall biosynthesis
MPNDSSTDNLPRVVIDVEKLRHMNTGLGRFSLHLAEEIIRLAAGRFRPILFLPPGAERLFPTGTHDVLQVAAWRREGCLRLARPFVRPFLARGRARMWHMTHQAAKYFPVDPRTPVLLTIHDLNFLHESPGSSSSRLRRKLAGVQRRIDRATAITTVSRFTADDVRKHLDVRDKVIHVVPNGMAAPPAASPARPQFLSAGPFLLTVGNVLPHKNFHVLLGMMEHLPGRRLVIAGKKATPYGAAMEREIAGRELGDRVIMPGEVSDGDRQWLYENCEAFLFPSLAEGFGFPVLEAMQCGKPVFISRATSLPEIAGDAAFYFDSWEAVAMAATFGDGMKRVAESAGFSRVARAHAARFTWHNAARAYIDLYGAVMETRP